MSAHRPRRSGSSGSFLTPEGQSAEARRPSAHDASSPRAPIDAIDSRSSEAAERPAATRHRSTRSSRFRSHLPSRRTSHESEGANDPASTCRSRSRRTRKSSAHTPSLLGSKAGGIPKSRLLLRALRVVAMTIPATAVRNVLRARMHAPPVTTLRQFGRPGGACLALVGGRERLGVPDAQKYRVRFLLEQSVARPEDLLRSGGIGSPAVPVASPLGRSSRRPTTAPLRADRQLPAPELGRDLDGIARRAHFPGGGPPISDR